MQARKWALIALVLSAAAAACRGAARWWFDEAYAVRREEIIPILAERESIGYWELFHLIPRGERRDMTRLKRALDRTLFLLRHEGVVELDTEPMPAQYLSVLTREENILSVRCALCA